jgi:hypothetical protein
MRISPVERASGGTSVCTAQTMSAKVGEGTAGATPVRTHALRLPYAISRLPSRGSHIDRQIAYWVHVTAEAVVSTGKGAKILVPATQTVDEAHRQALLDIASVTRPQPAWEGSAWAGAPTLARRDVLRHALIAPRLVAPHPNIGPTTPISPGQAVAMLVQARILDLEEYARRHPSVPSLDEARESSDWAWRFFGALGHRVTTGEVDGLRALIDEAPTEADRSAATVVAVAGLIEDGRPNEAIQLMKKL